MKHEICGLDPGCGLSFTRGVCLRILKLVGIKCKCFHGRAVRRIFTLIPSWWLSAKVAERSAIKSATGKKKVEAKAPGKAASLGQEAWLLLGMSYRNHNQHHSVS